MLNNDLLFSVPYCFLLGCLIKEATCNVMVDHLQSRVTPWRQYASHVKVRDTLSKMDVSTCTFSWIRFLRTFEVSTSHNKIIAPANRPTGMLRRRNIISCACTCVYVCVFGLRRYECDYMRENAAGKRTGKRSRCFVLSQLKLCRSLIIMLDWLTMKLTCILVKNVSSWHLVVLNCLKN